MKLFENIRGVAGGNFGLVTAAEARKLGVGSFQLARWVKMGWLEHSARGVYRLSDYPPSPYDYYAIAVEEVGADAMLYGESVLGMLELTATNPEKIRVGTVNQRFRKRVSDGVVVYRMPMDSKPELYEGVRCQPLVEAILASRDSVVPSRCIEAAENAFRKGYILRSEFQMLRKEISR